MKYQLIVMLLLALVLVGCVSFDPPPTRSIAEKWEYVEAAATEGRNHPIVYLPAGSESVTFTTVEYAPDLVAEVYYPPGFDFSSPLPAVIFVLGWPDSQARSFYGTPQQDFGQYVSWAQAVAASGMIAITYQTNWPAKDIIALLDYVDAGHQELLIDPSRLGFWSADYNAPIADWLIRTEDCEYRDAMKAAAFYYPHVGTQWGDPPEGMHVLVANPGGNCPGSVTKAGQYAEDCREAGLDVVLLNYDEGIRTFDLAQDTAESRRIIRETLEFLQVALLE